jgi:hypothetical protein
VRARDCPPTSSSCGKRNALRLPAVGLPCRALRERNVARAKAGPAPRHNKTREGDFAGGLRGRGDSYTPTATSEGRLTIRQRTAR